jgi:hypothetical protein
MPAAGKLGNPIPAFPPFPPSLEIAARFPHSHTYDDSSYNQSETQNPLPKTVTHVLGYKCYLCSRPDIRAEHYAAVIENHLSQICRPAGIEIVRDQVRGSRAGTAAVIELAARGAVVELAVMAQGEP